MNEPKDIQKIEKSGMTFRRRIIIAIVVIIVVIIGAFKASTFFAETGEFLQIFPAIPGVIGSISKGAASEKADLKPVEAALKASTSRVVSAEAQRTLNGFSVEVDVFLIVNDTVPITQEELLAMLTAFWQTVPFEPDSITIRAGTESDEIVDVKSAANMLTGVKVMDYNNYSTTIGQLDALLGPWKKPR